MALRRSSLLLALLATAAMAAPAWAEDYAVNYMSHSDSITIGLGDAPTSNIIIQHPTPWPSYVNKTDIPISAAIGTSALDNMIERYLNPSGTPTADAATTSSSGGMSSGSAAVSSGSN